jgi:hypothetical protein
VFELVTADAKAGVVDGTLDFTRVYQELIHEQTPGVSDDPRIVADSIRLAVGRSAPGDSTLMSAPPAPGTTGSKPTATNPIRLVQVTVSYDATIDRAVGDLKWLWDNVLRAHLLGLVKQKLSVPGVAITSERVEIDPVQSKVSAEIDLQATEGNLLELSVETEVDDDLGRILTPVYQGTAYAYLDQQGPPRRTRSRQVRAVFQPGPSLNQTNFYGTATVDGSATATWVLQQRRARERPYVVGLRQLAGTLSLVELNLSEDWLYVESTVTRKTTTGTGSP